MLLLFFSLVCYSFTGGLAQNVSFSELLLYLQLLI